ncbi:MAG: OmpA family protein [Myxococcaceae bacterium]|nr:OmpA family protein [Myxococcaceae bacterium]
MCCWAPLAAAQGGRLHLNADLGLGAPLSGRFGTAIETRYAAQSFGPHLTLGLDYQVLPPLALELIGEVGVQLIPSWLAVRNLEQVPSTVVLAGAGLGARLRLLDSDAGHLWTSLHVGFRAFEGAQLAVDGGGGYLFSLTRRFGLGPFARALVLAPSATSRRGATVLVTLGAAGSFDLLPVDPTPPPPADDDGDGLTNDVEQQLGTDLKKADTDSDGLRDDAEVSGKTDPLKADTDGDGVPDGVELTRRTNPLQPDTDRDGLSDGDEHAKGTDALEPDTDKDTLADGAEVTGQTDPLKADTDGDGLPDGVEVAGRTDALKSDTDGDGVSDGDEDKNKNGVVDEGETDPRVAPPPDTDGDGVADPSDNCPAVKGPADNQGCPKENKQLVVITKEKLEILDKVYFDTNGATVQKRSWRLLDQIVSILTAHPEIKKVQVEGHTDNVGAAEKNQKLSQRRAEAVVKYLSTKKVDPSRLEPIGYGAARPAVPNDTPAGREKNRRVEFKIVGE